MEKKHSAAPIDRGWAWAVVIASSCSAFIMVGTAKSIGIVLREMVPYFQKPVYLVYMLFTVASIMYTIFSPFSLILAEILPRRAVIIAGGLVAFVGVSLSSLVYSIEFVIVTCGIGLGIGNGCLYGNVLVLLSLYFSKRRSLANGIALAGASMGTLVLPPLYQFLLDTFYISGTLLIMSAIYLHIIVCGLVFRPVEWFTSRQPIILPLDSDHNKAECVDIDDTCELRSNENHEAEHVDIEVNHECKGHQYNVPHNADCSNSIEQEMNKLDIVEHHESQDFKSAERIRQRPKFKNLNASMEYLGGGDIGASAVSLMNITTTEQDEVKRTKPHGTISEKFRIMFDFSVLRNHICQQLAVFSVFAFFGYFNFIIFLPAIVTERGISDQRRALLVSIIGVNDLAARVGTGVLADLNLFPRYYIVVVCHLILAVDMIAFAWVSEYWLMAVQCSLYGLASGSYVSVFNIVVIDFLTIEKMPKALAVILLLQGSAAALGPVILGAIREVTDGFYAVVIVMGLSSFVACVILLSYPLVKRWELTRVTSHADQPIEESPIFETPAVDLVVTSEA